MSDYEKKYLKYKDKYLNEKQKGDNQKGGRDNDIKSEKSEKIDKDAGYIFNIKCIKVDKKDDVTHFTSTLCKTPAFKIKFHTKEVPWAKVIKSLLRFSNKSLRMKDIKEVVILEGKNKTSFTGDKIEGNLDLSNEVSYDEAFITL